MPRTFPVPTLAVMALAGCGWGTDVPSGGTNEPPPPSNTTSNDAGSGTCTDQGCGGVTFNDGGAEPPEDATPSPTETFALRMDAGSAKPLSCPSAHWEYSDLAASLDLRNTGTVPLAYVAEDATWDPGAEYTPGVPTGMSMERAGVLAPGEEVALAGHPGDYAPVALLGASKPFSIDDGGFAAADEWTIPWPQGVSGSGGSATMHVAEIEDVAGCGPVTRP